MIVDVHTHIWNNPDQLGKAAAERIRNMTDDPWHRPHATPEAHTRAMQAVDHAFVLGFESTYLDALVPAKQVADVVALNPVKNIGFVGVDPLGGGYIERLDEAIDLGLKGVVVCPAATGCHPTHTRAMRLYEKCAEQSMPVLVHMGSHFGADAMMEFSQPFLFDEVARSFPNLRLVIAQVGYPWVEQTLVLLSKHRTVYADLSQLALRQWHLYNALLSAYQQKVIDHLLLGSDFPFSTPEKMITTIYGVNTFTQGTHLPSVPREQLRTIVERDVIECLGIEVEQAPAATAASDDATPTEPAETSAEKSADETDASGEDDTLTPRTEASTQ